MDSDKHIIILGSSRLALQVGKLLQNKGHIVRYFPTEHFDYDSLAKQKTNFEYAKETLGETSLQTAKAVFILDDDDGRNLQLSLATMTLDDTIPIFISLANESLYSHLRTTHKNLFVLNPTETAALVFVNALRDETVKLLPSNPGKKNPLNIITSNSSHIFYKLCGVFLCLIAAGTIFFRVTEGKSWIDSFYLMTTVITSVNFNDVSLTHYSFVFKLARVILLLGTQFLILLIFSFIIDHLAQYRIETYTLGRRKYHFKNHVVVCGMGRVGQHVVNELLKRKEKVIIIEKSPDNNFAHIAKSRGVSVLVGDASLIKNLSDANIMHAAGLISTVNDDLENLEIGLNARVIRPNLRLILRIFDKEMADEVRQRLDVQYAFSTSAIAAEEFLNLFEKSVK